MTNSQFCIQQRQQEQQRLRKLLVVGFAGSAAVHGILAYAFPRWSFEPPQTASEPIEMILVDKPQPKPEPKIESKPVVEPSFEDKPEPKPVQPPEPVQAQTPPPPVQPPEPVPTQAAPPKPEPTPAPKEVLTTPTPAPAAITSAPVENTAQPSSFNSSFAAPSSSVATADSSASSQGKPGGMGSVAVNSAPPRPETNNSEEGISCVSNCEPEYPAALEGAEGSAQVKLTVNSDGSVIGAELTEPNSNSGVNRQALLAARQMQFSSPGNSSAAVRVNFDFTVEGSEYDRARREEQKRREQAAKERQEQEVARQQQLEQERQARQEQLERERQARQEQLQQQQESTPPPIETKPESKPLPTLSPEELDEERLRKFRERIENYHN